MKIYKATENDVKDILRFINDLAVYEKLEHEVVATEQSLKDTLFCEQPVAHVLFAELDNKKIGMALYFYSYSTFLAKKGIYLEDLFVQPEYRGQGAGKRLLAELAKIAVDEDCGRLEWSVLNWNTPSIKFYESLNAQPMNEWTPFRLSDKPLKDLSDKASAPKNS